MVWPVGTNLHTQVGAGWALQSYLAPWEQANTSTSRCLGPRTRGVGSPRVLAESPNSQSLTKVYHQWRQKANHFLIRPWLFKSQVFGGAERWLAPGEHRRCAWLAGRLVISTVGQMGCLRSTRSTNMRSALHLHCQPTLEQPCHRRGAFDRGSAAGYTHHPLMNGLSVLGGRRAGERPRAGSESGGMAERTMAVVLKTTVAVMSPGVRIPLPPPWPSHG